MIKNETKENSKDKKADRYRKIQAQVAKYILLSVLVCIVIGFAISMLVQCIIIWTSSKSGIVIKFGSLTGYAAAAVISTICSPGVVILWWLYWRLKGLIIRNRVNSKKYKEEQAKKENNSDKPAKKAKKKELDEE